MKNALLKLTGWKLLALHGDPSTFDRLQWLKKHLQKGPFKTLDAGCGNGVFTFYASSIRNQATGICWDRNSLQLMQSRALQLGTKNAKFLQGDLRTLDEWNAELGKFDQIICFETIEHIQNDKKLILDLANLLKPQGTLLLTTPYKNYRRLLGDHISPEEDGGHVRWGYTHEEIRNLFHQCGLRVLTESYISGVISQQLINLMRALSKIHPAAGWMATLPLRIFLIFDTALTNLIQYPRLSLGVVAVKEIQSRGNNIS